MGITNAQDVLEVSPLDTALELTQKTAAVPGAPDNYYEAQKTYGRTFARVVPSASQEATAQAQEMAGLGVKTLYVSSDGSPYGAAIALAVRQAATAHSITVSPSASGADGAFYGASSASAAATAFDKLAQSSPTIKLFGPSAVASGLTTSAQNVYISAPGFLSKELPAVGHKFVSDFTAAVGHAPAPEAIFAYEAVAAVDFVVHQAGSAANDRSTVVRNFWTHWRASSSGSQ